MNDHLEPVPTARGFKHLPALEGHSSGSIRVYESSLAFQGPHTWLQVVEANDLNRAAIGDLSAGTHEATIQLCPQTIQHLIEQLQYIQKNHFLADESDECIPLDLGDDGET